MQEQAFYNLLNLRVTLAGGGSGIIDLKIKRNPEYGIRWPGQSLVPSNVFIGENFPDITATVYEDEDRNFLNTVPNQEIGDLEMISPNDGDIEVFEQLFTRFPPSSMAFGGVDTTYARTVGQMTVPIISNVLNLGADGGYPA